MSADRLREAALALRMRAEMATPGPWKVDPYWTPDHVGYCVEPNDEGGGTSPIDCERPEDAAFIATMHPGVALALADWLDIASDDHDSGCPTDCPANRAADLILGAES